MVLPPVRTITLGIAETHPLSREVIGRAAVGLRQAGRRFEEAGYEVQTLRVATRPVFDDLREWSAQALLHYVVEVQRVLDDVGLAFCSVGPAQVARRNFPLERVELVADLLAATSAINATVQLATVRDGLRVEGALPTARVIKRLAQETEEGFGNFRFAMIACVEAGCPFFPTAYHLGPARLSLGLQGASIVTEAIQSLQADGVRDVDLAQVSARVRANLLACAAPVVELGRKLASEQGLVFGGIDLSPAPLAEDSIVAGLELCGYGAIGSPGTVAAAAAITAALRSTSLPTCGYCGLMLPVLEDAHLGRRWEEGCVNIHQLLLYSTVCGTGLDTIPLAGACTVEEIAHILLDVAMLALRQHKPLSARLFPVPGRGPGERTRFTSPYLSNTVVR